jgi:FdhE protein
MIGRWDARIARAEQLAGVSSSASSVLTFYARLAGYQKSLTRLLPDTESDKPSLLEALDVEVVLGALPDFLLWVQRTAPAQLAEAAGQMRADDTVQHLQLVHQYFLDQHHTIDDADESVTFVVEALLQPFAEWFAAGSRPSAGPTSNQCPVCSGLPVLGVLREEGHGARRSLVCGLCFTEWDYLRVICPRCREQRFDALPVFTAEQFAHVRLAACDSCRTYLKTIDLTKDGLAIPIVDDIASVSLDLWARDQGYVRLRPNLLRL